MRMSEVWVISHVVNNQTHGDWIYTSYEEAENDRIKLNDVNWYVMTLEEYLQNL